MVDLLFSSSMSQARANILLLIILSPQASHERRFTSPCASCPEEPQQEGAPRSHERQVTAALFTIISEAESRYQLSELSGGEEYEVQLDDALPYRSSLRGGGGSGGAGQGRGRAAGGLGLQHGEAVFWGVLADLKIFVNYGSPELERLPVLRWTTEIGA